METMQINGTPRERWYQYHRHVESMLPLLESREKFTPLMFACESAYISNEDHETIPWPFLIRRLKKEWEVQERKEIAAQFREARSLKNEYLLEAAKQRKKEMKFPLPQWAEDFKLNDEMIAESCLNSKGRRREIMHPLVINMSLCRIRTEAKWRNATYIGTNTGFPHARHIRKLVDVWIRMALVGARKLEKASDIDRSVFSWALHDAFLSIQPFKDGNERTARALMQLVRRELDLPTVFFSRRSKGLHQSRIRTFRAEIFMPLMERHGYLE